VERPTRTLLLSMAAVVYVGFAALGSRGGMLPIAALVVLPLALVVVWRRTGTARTGEDRPDLRKAARACAWGAAIWAAARTGGTGHAALDAVSSLGAGVAAVAALVSLARTASPGGLLTPPAAARSLDAAAFAALVWGIAVAVPATRAILPPQSVRLDPLAIDYATTSAGAASLLVLVVASWRLRLLRRLELGVGDRAGGALAFALTAFAVAVPAALLDVAAPDRVLPAAVVVGSIACTWAATTREPTTVASALRGILALLILGAPAMLLFGVLARRAPDHAGAVVLVSAAVCIAIGLAARRVARPLGPEQSRWLDAIDAASRGALQPEPDAAIQAALMALGRLLSTPGARPELWRTDPAEVLSVDLAGYLHVEAAEAPERLYELALAEPERTLRAEVLRALEVRRADLRPLSAWFDARRAFAATIVLDEDGPLGFLLLPRGTRSTPMTLEEARALRILGDRVSALLAVSSALARSRARELGAVARADETEKERQRLQSIFDLEGSRNLLVAERLARGVRANAYGPAARVALEAVERAARTAPALALRAAAGVDPLGWAAVAHGESPRRLGPFVVVDGASAIEHDVERWRDPARSPLALAEGGTLVVLDVQALPLAVQEELAGRAGLIVSSRAALPPVLASTIGHELALPTLAERSEDLRSLVLDELSRAGLRRRGEPLGVELGALRVLCEHTWPGNELELRAVLGRAAEVAEGSVVTSADLAQIGFRASEQEADSSPALAEVLPRARPRRLPRRRP
jgi:hypothetical protein